MNVATNIVQQTLFAVDPVFCAFYIKKDTCEEKVD